MKVFCLLPVLWFTRLCRSAKFSSSPSDAAATSKLLRILIADVALNEREEERTLKKVSISVQPRRVSAMAKIAEFRRLRYPLSVLQKACNVLGASTAERTWITVRDALR